MHEDAGGWVVSGRTWRHLTMAGVAIAAVTLATGFDRRIVRTPIDPGVRAMEVAADRVAVITVADTGLSAEDGWRFVGAQADHGTVEWEDARILYTPSSMPGTKETITWRLRHPAGRLALGSKTLEVVPAGTIVFDIRAPSDWTNVTDLEVRQAGLPIDAFQPPDETGRARLSVDGLEESVLELVGTLQAANGSTHRIAAVIGTPDQLLESIQRREIGSRATPEVVLNPVSSALHARLSTLPTDAMSDARSLELVLPGLGARWLLEFATVFDLVVSGQISLPEGFDDAYALIGDPQAVSAVLEKLGVEPFAQAREALIAELASHINFDQNLAGEELLEDGVVAAFGARSNIGFALAGDVAFGFEGRGRFSPHLQADVGMTWSAHENVVLITPNEPYPLSERALHQVECPSQSIAFTREIATQIRWRGVYSLLGRHFMLQEKFVTKQWEPHMIPEDCELPDLGDPYWKEVSTGLVDRRWSEARRADLLQDRLITSIHGFDGVTGTPGLGTLDLGSNSVEAEGHAPAMQVVRRGPGTGEVRLQLLDSGEWVNVSWEVVAPAAADTWSASVTRVGAGGEIERFISALIVDPSDPVELEIDGLWAHVFNGLQSALIGPTDASGHAHVLIDSEGAYAAELSGYRSSEFRFNAEYSVQFPLGGWTGSNYRTADGELVLECPEGESCTLNRRRAWQVLRHEPDFYGEGRDLVVAAVQLLQYAPNFADPLINFSSIQYLLRDGDYALDGAWGTGRTGSDDTAD